MQLVGRHQRLEFESRRDSERGHIAISALFSGGDNHFLGSYRNVLHLAGDSGIILAPGDCQS